MTRFDLVSGAGIDLAIGDPLWLPHPIRGIGSVIASTEKFWRSTGLPLRLAGAGHTVCVVALASGVVWVTLPRLSIYWIWSLLAMRSLDKESNLVVRHLAKGDIVAARASLSWIVGRDTSHLDEAAILRAVLETVSENFSDAVVAPLFWLAVAGPAGMAGYKAVSTLDSMVGYKNDRYREFGTAAARLDDLLNYVPARLSALLIAAAAVPAGLDWKAALGIAFRDGASQPSPNSGYPEAAFAGALAVRLGGMNSYGGVLSHKAFLGDDRRPVNVSVHAESRLLYWTACALAVAVAWAAVK